MTIPHLRLALTSSAVAAACLIGTASDQALEHSAAAAWRAPESASAAYLNETSANPNETPSARSRTRVPATPPCDLLSSLRPQGPLPEPGRMPPGSTMARILERGQLIVAAGPGTYLLNSPNLVTGELEGFEIDLAGDIAEAIFGDRRLVEYRQLDLPGRLEAVESGDVDLAIATVTITCQRRATLEFSAVYYEAGQRVLVNRGSGVTGLDDLAGKRVCATRGSTSLQKILATQSRPIPVGVPSVMDCLVMLQLGEVDAVSTDDTLLAGMAKQDPQTETVGPRLSSEPYGVVLNPADSDLVRFVNAVLERRVADGRWLASYQRWLAELGPPSIPLPQYRD